MEVVMDVRFNQGRVLINPFKETDDQDPDTKKFGIRTHNKILGCLLHLIGKADQVEGYDTNKHKRVVFYVNTNSAIKWCHRHGLKEIDPWQDPGHMPDIKQALNTISKIKQLSIAIQKDPSYAKALIERGELFRFHKNWSAAIRDFTEALKLPITEKEKILCLFCRADCFMEIKTAESRESALADYERLKEINPQLKNPADCIDSRVPDDFIMLIREFEKAEKPD